MPIIEKFEDIAPERFERLHSMCQKCIKSHMVDKGLRFEIHCRPIEKGKDDFKYQYEQFRAQGMSEEDALHSAYAINVNQFARDFVGLPSWSPVQDDMYLCTANRKVGRVYRRSGKTVSSRVLALHRAYFWPQTILIVAPYEDQIVQFFDSSTGGLQQLITGAAQKGKTLLMEEVIIPPGNRSGNIFRARPRFEIAFRNGSIIAGKVLRSSNKSRGSSLRGSGVVGMQNIDEREGEDVAGMVILDECVAEGSQVNVSQFAVRPVESLTLEDSVLGGNGHDVHSGPIHALSKRSAEVITITTPISRLVCTPEHPLFDGEKDIYAKDATHVIVAHHHQELLFSAESVLARLTGYNFGDGWLTADGQAGFSGQACDLEQVAEDIAWLGGTRNKIHERITENKNKGIRGTTAQVGSRWIYKLLKDFCPIGFKVHQPLIVPPHIMRAKNHVKAQFLSGLFSAEATHIRYQANGITPATIDLRMRSASPEWILAWMQQIQQLLTDLGINSTIYPPSPIEDKFQAAITVNNSLDNIDRFCNRVGFCYSISKRRAANSWEIFRSHRRMGKIPLRGGPKVQDLLKTMEWIPGYLRLPVSPYSRRNIGEATVYNLTSGASNRFFAGGILTHNCDYLDSEDWRTVNPIIEQLQENECIEISTPQGKRETFHEHCTISSKHREIYYPITKAGRDRPDISEAPSEQMRQRALENIRLSCRDNDEFIREWMAEFGMAGHAIFNPEDLRFLSQKDWEYSEPILDIDTCPVRSKRQGVIRTIGADWNKPEIGLRLWVCEFTPATEGSEQGNYRLIDRWIVAKHEFTQLASANAIICANRIFRPDFIYTDSGFGDCVGPETLISSRDGIREIADIEPGDHVLSHDGRWHQILAKVVRDDPKPTYEVRVAKSLPVRVSDTHPFLAIRQPKKFNSKDKVNQNDLTWLNVTQLEEGDLIAVPKLDTPLESPLVWDLSKLVEGVEFDETHVWFPTGFTPNPEGVRIEEIISTIGTSRSTLTRLNRQLRYGQEPTGLQKSILNRIIDTYGCYNPPRPNRIPRFVELTSPAFLRLLGWYLSEGHAHESFVEISQSTDRRDWIDSIFSDFEECFGVSAKEYVKIPHPNSKSPGRECSQIVVSSKILAVLFRTIGGGPKETKRIHPDLIRRWDRLGPMIRTLMLGDGHLSCQSWRLSLTALGVVDQVRSILVSHGIVPNTYVRPPQRDGHRAQLTIDVGGDREVWERFISLTGLSSPPQSPIRRRRRSFVETENYVLLPVRRIQYVGEIRGLVDIQVAGSQSFVGNGLLLHNTQVEKIKQYSLLAAKDPSKGRKHPDVDLVDILKPIAMSEMVPVVDPAFPHDEKMARKIQQKTLIINFFQSMVEERSVFINHKERHESSGSGLIKAATAYKVERISSHGHPIYTGENDHDIIAAGLALYAFWKEWFYGRKISPMQTARIISGGGKGDSKPSVDLLPKMKPDARGGDASRYHAFIPGAGPTALIPGEHAVTQFGATLDDPKDEYLKLISVNGVPVPRTSSKPNGGVPGSFSRSRNPGFSKRRI